MAKKSKTQRAKASAARQQRKAVRSQQEDSSLTEASSSEEQAKKGASAKSAQKDTSSASSDAKKKADVKKAEAKKTDTKKADAKKPRKTNRAVQFFRDVRTEMHRVTWPTRLDVLRWSGVVVVALLFFGIFVAVLDNLVITPLLYLVAGIGE